MKIFKKIKNLIQKNQANLADNQFFTNKTDIMKWLDKCRVENYTINDDLTVDVGGNVDLFDKNLKIIPVKFGKVNGDFCCYQLSSLIGSPKSVGRDFFTCSNNKLTNLAGSPEYIGGNFWCWNNPLISFLEIINCDFKGEFYFNIDKKNFKQKELIQTLKKYYNSKYDFYKLTNRQFYDIIKPVLEKNILKNNLKKSKVKLKLKKLFI